MKYQDEREVVAREILTRYLEAGKPTKKLSKFARKLLAAQDLGVVDVNAAVAAIIEVLEVKELRAIVTRYDDKMRQIDDKACRALEAVKSGDTDTAESLVLNILTLSV